ncbi:SIS domain-containing protein [Spongiactinospora sp. TRM90649]|uniref:SIS domain-containing protein n=1 Tax=Spongiactinospora sp. TRM90649 TaxID=3031114 RepID=UPI0023F95290|nr:SIS domain-containing protein [Spongiactinospora sp. TRM90649]MDF5756748.1 SIS domain-containing protein [Spongiactinospora sp. TRM90649]
MTSSLVTQAFAHAYLRQVDAALRRMLESGGEAAAQLMRTAVAGGGLIRGFGNGGSSAIVRSALLQLRAGHAGLPVNDSMISPAAMAYWAQQDSYRMVFRRSLAGDIQDVGLVILASVSGRSANIIEAAALCRTRQVPVLALVGGRGDQLGPVDGMLWATGTTDQQLSEAVSRRRPSRLGRGTLRAQPPLGRALRSEGSATPIVICDPSLADMSAIYNDHPDPAHGVRYQLHSAASGDVVFLLAYDSHRRTNRQALDAARQAGAQVFLLHRDGPTLPAAGWRSQRLPAVDDFGLPCLVQSIAHMICRTTRAALAADSATAGPSPHDLMTRDLAPLRELSDSHGPR